MKLNKLFIAAGLFLAACQQVPRQVVQESAQANKFHQQAIRDIHTLKDERNTAKLLPFLRSPEAALRREAAFALASVQDTSAVLFLSELLTDTEPTVRGQAAFALGQTGGKATQAYLADAIATETNPQVLSALLEAYGKVTEPAGIALLLQTTSADTVVAAGRQWGLYRAATRGITPTDIAEKTVPMLQPQNAFNTRLAASHTLARTQNVDLTPYETTLVALANTEKSAIIRSNLVSALAKVKSDKTASVLSKIAASDADYRVRITAVRALGKQSFSVVSDAVFRALADADAAVALTAAEVILANAKPADAKKIAASAETLQNWRVRAVVLQAALRNAPANEKAQIRNTINNRYQKTTNLYEKAHLLKAMAEDLEFFPQVSEVLLTAAHPVMRSYAAEALTDMRTKENFNESLKPVFAEVFQKAVAREDVAITGIIATAIRNPAGGLKNDFRSFAFLEAARDKLTLPRDMETYIELQKTLDYVNGITATTTPKTVFTHPINWQLVQTIPANQKVRLITSKGEIVLQLDVNNAPGSVASFVELARKGFYDGKVLHRVVPNFVIQDGCPRGDGWGSTDYNIRSEFTGIPFLEGSVGLASAGKDTESCQWFITHTATPHLDGRYTNFARVVKGMEVVHQLEIGDKIESVVLQ